MAEKYYYMRNGGQISGPFSQTQLERFLDKGLVTGSCYVSEDRVAWKMLSEILDPEADAETEVEVMTEVDVCMYTGKDFEARNEDVASVIPESHRTPQVMQGESAHAKAPEVKTKAFVVPDPICATIALIWNARKQLTNLILMQDMSEEDGTVDSDRCESYAIKTAVWLIMLQVLSVFFCSFTRTHGQYVALLITVGVLFLVCGLLLFLENLFIAMVENTKKIVEPFLLVMQFLCATTIIFCVGMPLFALYCVGWSVCPVWLRWLSVVFAGVILMGSVVNLFSGCFSGYRSIFRFSKTKSAILAAVFILQVLAVFPAGYYLFELIQNKMI